MNSIMKKKGIKFGIKHVKGRTLKINRSYNIGTMVNILNNI